MKYMEHLQSGLGFLVAASDAERGGESEMLEPLNGAISELRCAANALECQATIDEEQAARLWRVLRAIQVAQATLNACASDQAEVVRPALDLLEQQVMRGRRAIERLASQTSPCQVEVLPTSDFVKKIEIPRQALGADPHLLVLQPLSARSEAVYFNLDTTGVQSLQRGSRFACSTEGESERITLSALIHPSFKDGARQLQQLRSFGQQETPLSLCTGQGEPLGIWRLAAVNESQGALLAGGVPENQAFTLELVSHDDDLPNC